MKEKYEAQAKQMAQEQAAKQAEADRAFNESLNQYPPSRSQSPAAGQSEKSPARSGSSGQQQGKQTVHVIVTAVGLLLQIIFNLDQ